MYHEPPILTKMQLKRPKLTKPISLLYGSKFKCNDGHKKTFFVLCNTEKPWQAIYYKKNPQNQDQNNIRLSQSYTTKQILTHVKSARLSSISWEHNLDRNFSEEKHSPPPKNAKTNHTKIRHSSVHFSSARDGENIWQATDFRHIPQSTGRRHASAEYRAEDRQNRHVSNDLLPVTSRHLDVPCGNKQ